MKKKIAALALAVICLAILSSGTIAYFTASRTVHNVITSGAIDIEIIEKSRGDNGRLDDFPEGGIQGVMPGSSISKLVSVKNKDGADAWIRVRVGQSIIGRDGKSLPLSLKNGDRVMDFLVDEDKWTYWEGWYYYREPVSPLRSTELLFEGSPVCRRHGQPVSGVHRIY